jgi:hypothetical protein
MLVTLKKWTADTILEINSRDWLNYVDPYYLFGQKCYDVVQIN